MLNVSDAQIIGVYGKGSNLPVFVHDFKSVMGTLTLQKVTSAKVCS